MALRVGLRRRYRCRSSHTSLCCPAGCSHGPADSLRPPHPHHRAAGRRHLLCKRAGAVRCGSPALSAVPSACRCGAMTACVYMGGASRHCGTRWSGLGLEDTTHTHMHTHTYTCPLQSVHSCRLHLTRRRRVVRPGGGNVWHAGAAPLAGGPTGWNQRGEQPALSVCGSYGLQPQVQRWNGGPCSCCPD